MCVWRVHAKKMRIHVCTHGFSCACVKMRCVYLHVFSAEKLALKMLRNLGDMELLINAIAKIQDKELGLKEISKKE